MQFVGEYSRFFRSVVAVTMSMAATFGAAAQQVEVSDSATIHFPQSRYGISSEIPGNSEELNQITDFMRRYSDPDSGYTLRSIRIIGGASPEGSVAINERLSRQRAASIFDYISQREAMPDSIATFEFLGRDWRGLRRLVGSDAEVPYRADVLALIDETIEAGAENATASDRGLARLRSMHRGVPYRYLYSRHFPALRASKLLVEYEALPAAPVTVDTLPEAVTEVVVEEEFAEIVMDTVITCRPFYMGLKTNMLYDALALPTIGAEFYVGKGWSVGSNWTYGWWSKNSRHRYWRAYGGDINVRR